MTVRFGYVFGMEHAPDTFLSPFARPSNDPTTNVGAAFTALPVEGPPLPNDSTLVDQSGRALGARALKTRARILEATLDLLDEKSMRDIRVIDIARRIGSSPATFYQYFKDIEDVVLELATHLHSSAPAIVDAIQGTWDGREGYEHGRRLAELFIVHWDRYASILRVRNNAAEEGDADFANVRFETLLPIVTAFANLIREVHPIPPANPPDGDWQGGPIHPISAAFILTGALEGMILHHHKFENRFGTLGEGQEEIINTIASLFQQMLSHHP